MLARGAARPPRVHQLPLLALALPLSSTWSTSAYVYKPPGLDVKLFISYGA